MKATIEISLQSFRTPNFVLTQPAPALAPPLHNDEIRYEQPKYRLNELSEETLNKLCDQFRDDIFKKAGINRAELIANEEDDRNI